MDEENETKSITIELKVYMHCDACERKVRRTINKVEGVETVEVDREEKRVTVTGDFEPEKVVKKIKKKTGKKAEILIPEEDTLMQMCPMSFGAIGGQKAGISITLMTKMHRRAW
ncbi:hypothetical protein C2845_PM16G11670 [Panicum miliaceum]|uniref:HMA domain-containing protein n=1 Tax=Panicum miliaceum TaxID=4540 RepID=A0A3L6PU89_PANMI|nr:hypothetical protein C2845_PM16G11670 [Panicum miliaceum]